MRRWRTAVLGIGCTLCVLIAAAFVVSGWWLLPLCALFVAVLLATLAVWWFMPKYPRGHCRRCGYNLTGLTESRCPECR